MRKEHPTLPPLAEDSRPVVRKLALAGCKGHYVPAEGNHDGQERKAEATTIE